MLRISKLTDYSIVILTALAKNAELSLSAKNLADQTSINPPTVSKILKMLSNAQLVESFRGTDGGYRLAKPADKITLTLIICAMEGPLAITECNLAEQSCSQASSCNIRTHWQYINKQLINTFDNISLQDMTTSTIEEKING